MYQVQFREQQESRPLLSPSIDDFLSESRADAPCAQPPASNTAVLSAALDLVDLSEPGESGGGGNKEQRRRSPLRRKAGSLSPRRRSRPDETELIQVEAELLPERVSLDSVSLSPLHRGDDEDGGRRRPGKRCSSHHSSSELLWCAEFKTDPQKKNSLDVHSLDDFDFSSHTQECVASTRRRRTRSLLDRKESLEDEFVRAKAAVESDTEFWDKMQAEWEELARRNWLEESEDQAPPPISPADKGYVLNTNNPYREWPNAFAEGQEKAREGDLNAAVLLLEAAILQDPQDSEVMLY